MQTGRYKSRQGWCASLISALALLCTAGFSQEPPLLQRAVKEPQMDAEAHGLLSFVPCPPLGDNLLAEGLPFVPFQHKLYLYHPHTQVSTPLVKLTQLVNATQASSNLFCLHSPDNRRLLWFGTANDHPVWDVSLLDGSQHVQWPRLQSSYEGGRFHINLNFIQWLEDSRHVAEGVFDFPSGQTRITVCVHDVQDGSVTKTVFQLLLSAGSVGPGQITADRRLLVNTWDMWKLGRDKPGSQLVDMHHLEMYAWSLDDPSKPPRKWTLNAPPGTEIRDVEVSPQGDRIAWQLERLPLPPTPVQSGKSALANRANTRDTRELWISGIDGGHMKLLGAIEAAEDDNAIASLMLTWLPDGKRLSFEYDRASWTIPAD